MTEYAVEALEMRYDVTTIRISTADGLDGLGEPSVRKLIRLLRILMRVIRETWLRRFDLVYITLSPTSGAFFKDAFLFSLARLRVSSGLIHLHGKGVRAAVARRPWMGPLYRLVFGLGTVIHLAESLVGDIAGFARKVRVLPNGIPVPDAVSGERDLDFLFLSNMIESKGPFVLLQALRSLADEGIGFKAAFCGKFLNETDRRRFQSLVAGLPNGSVELIEGLYGHAKFALLRRAKVFVLPTFYPNECFPLSILEAMGSGCAVVSTEEGAISDMLDGGRSGFIVRREDPAALAVVLRHLRDDRASLQKFSDAGKQRFLSLYTKHAFVSGLLTISEDELKRGC